MTWWRPFNLLLMAVLVISGCAGASEERESSTTSPPTDGVPPVVSTSIPDVTPTSTVVEPETTTYLVWTSGGLTDEMVAGLEGKFDNLSIVSGDAAPLDVGDGQVVPLDAIAIDTAAHAAFDPGGETSILRPGSVLLGKTSASYRGLSPGDSLSFAGEMFDVAGVVSDDLVGAAEVVFARDDPRSPVVTNRYALIKTDLERSVLESNVTGMTDGPVPARIKAEGETPWLRHADSVLPQIFIKIALGEFSYPADSGAQLVQDREFVSGHIVDVDLPLLGRVTCHEVIVEMLTGALNQLIAEGLADLVDPGEFAGCWNPRFTRTVTGTPSGVSRHSWGAAVDINAASNRLGTEGTQDPRLVEIMEEWGFLWGGDWSVPDPMHFEYGVPPED